MDLSGILSISGRPGLYKMSGQLKNGIIVESLIDGKRSPAYASEKISALEDISIYTEDEDVPLVEIFKSMFEKSDGKPAIDHQVSGQELKDYFESVLPDYDQERVYTSDIKKVVRWFNLLVEKGMLELKEEPAEEKKEAKGGDKQQEEEE